MASAIIFIISLYLAIPFTAVFPVLIYNLIPFDSLVVFWVISILLLIAVFSIVLLTGIICIAKTAYNTDKIKKLHNFIKLAPVPLFILNFIFLLIFSPMLFPAVVFIIPINGLMCCSAIVISGIIGFQRLRKAEKEGKTIKRYHYILQFIPVLDIISTIIIIDRKVCVVGDGVPDIP